MWLRSLSMACWATRGIIPSGHPCVVGTNAVFRQWSVFLPGSPTSTPPSPPQGLGVGLSLAMPVALGLAPCLASSTPLVSGVAALVQTHSVPYSFHPDPLEGKRGGFGAWVGRGFGSILSCMAIGALEAHYTAQH